MFLLAAHQYMVRYDPAGIEVEKIGRIFA